MRQIVMPGLLAIATCMGAGCASVDVRKIDAKGDASGPSGIRFNRPRPYIAVHEPFIVSAKAYLVNGQVSPDGKFVLITKATDNLDGTLRTALGDRIESSRVLLSTPDVGGGAGGGVQSAKEDLTPKLPGLPGTGTAESPEPGGDGGGGNGAGGGAPPAPAEKTGQGTFKVIVDNSAFATQPLRRYADVIYLPDFDEEFVVQVSQRLGNASAQVSLGQGWSLQGLDARVDNDAITRRLFALYDDSIKIALQLGKTALGIPGVPGGVQSARDAADLTAAQLPAGTNVTLKVTVVRMVAPGVYPILKPAEGKYVLDNIATLRQRIPDLDRRLLIPVYPMTNVAFNTYESVVLEAAPATGDSPLRLQQYIDTTGGSLLAAGGSGGGSGAPIDLNNGTQRKSLEGGIAAVLKLQDEPGTYTVTITPKSSTEGDVKVATESDALSPAVIKSTVEKAAASAHVTLNYVEDGE